jgi:anion-transporting  ArsA/GET3 family ATPase
MTRAPHKSPEIIVCVGGGGVGKTTTSAALALSLARAGRRTLVVTIDPARRLADALGTSVGSKVQPVTLPGAEGRLFALMPEPREAMRLFTEYLCADEPEALERLLRNRLYRVLEEAVPGIHELVCMTFVTRAAEELDLDTIVIDTAPSRFAIDFVTYPRRLGKLLGNRAIAWLSGLSAPEEASQSRSSRWFAWGRRRAEQALAGVLGPNAVTDVAELFTAMTLVRERFVELSQRASDLLLVKETRYLLVTAPTGAASDNVRYLHARLRQLKLTPVALIVNQGLDVTPAWSPLLNSPDPLAPDLAEVLAQLEAEHAARVRAAEAVRSEFHRSYRRLPQIPLPYVEAARPREVVLALAAPFGDHLRTVSARARP